MTKNLNKPSDEEILKGQIDMDLVTKLLKSNITTYQISKMTGVNLGNLFQIRNGKRKIRNLKITTAYLLSEYAKKIGIK